ncbi:alpha-protein kinase vwkA-like [Patiria miniata]|uniref:Alpha-type protein kinase domain-containing protein n=1 Tax=Patiria miniata TaxID=46514 RepID=A0A914AFN7_PATMI|nr:alpha-protein kinase vwkA-like [Patiria miniata]
MGNNQGNRCLPIEGTRRRVEFEDNWFAEGRSRRAYRGTYHGDRRVEGNKCVVKLYKQEWCDRMGELAYRADIRASERAQEMAMAFKQKYPTIESIEFVQPEISKIDHSSAFKLLGFIPIHKRVKGKTTETKVTSKVMIPTGSTVAVERYLEGEFIRFLSNTGYQGEEVLDTLPSAFSHFTFHISNGQILVCDLKGLRWEHGYVFTDPAIHSQTAGDRPNYFGPTDLGVLGMIKFFQNHRCNELCEGFLKPDLVNIRPRHTSRARRITDRPESTYMQELERHSPVGFELLSSS